jgi:hypothetical protein
MKNTTEFQGNCLDQSDSSNSICLKTKVDGPFLTRAVSWLEGVVEGLYAGAQADVETTATESESLSSSHSIELFIGVLNRQHASLVASCLSRIRSILS